MGTKNNPAPYDCFENAEGDEPMFVLLARDPLAANLVRVWVARQFRCRFKRTGLHSEGTGGA